MTGALETQAPTSAAPAGQALTVARNVATRYAAIGAEMVVGLLVLPFNIAHLGQSAYGLWMLTGSVTAYFSVLDLGYSGALVKFVARYRARHDIAALNEILSTSLCLFTALGTLTVLVAGVVAAYLGRLFHLDPADTHLARLILMIVTLNVACGTSFSVFGGVTNGFQRYDLNNLVGGASSAVVALVNVAVLWLGFGLLSLVVATTAVRLLTYLVYRAIAYRVFPDLRLRIRLFRRARVKEITSFSVYMFLIDSAKRLNYSVDAIVIGAALNTSAVAVWSVGQRLAEGIQRLTNQLNDVLFPTVVDNDTTSQITRLQQILLVGTRLSLATVVPLAGAVTLLAGPLVRAWVGPQFAGAIVVLDLLALTVIVRVGTFTASTLLKGAGAHRFVAWNNVGTAVANLMLSLALVNPLGLAGVAIGTMVPVVLSCVFGLFLSGCRHVALPVGQVCREAVWPAVWPAAVMSVYVWLTRDLFGASLMSVATELLAAVLVYAATFLGCATGRAERRAYFGQLSRLTAGWHALRLRVSEGA